jgi:ferredoxin--NADP+ reductase
MAALELNAVVTQKIDVTPELMILRVVPDGWELPEFVPGQFAVLGLPGSAPRCELSDPEETPPDPDKLIRRSYSIASSSLAKEYIEFYINIVRSGVMTPRLFALKPGDRVFLGKKFTGVFRLSDAPEDADIVMIATGTGLAPYMSMLRTHLEADEARKTALIHGARHSWDLGYRSELVSLQRLMRNFSYIPVVSRPDEEPARWSGVSGHVQDVWKAGEVEKVWGRKPTPGNTHVFLCGNPDMVEQMVVLLGEEGFREHTKLVPGQVHVERYW